MKVSKSSLIAVALVFLIVLTVSVVADQAYPQIACEHCGVFFGADGYCQANVCYVREAQPVTQPTTQQTVTTQQTQDPFLQQQINQQTTNQLAGSFQQTAISNTEFATLKQRVDVIESTLKGLSQSVNTIQTSYNALQGSINQLQQTTQSVQEQQNQIVALQQEVAGVSVGLAGLQEDVTETKTEIATIEEEVSTSQSSTRSLSWGLIIILIAAAGGGIFYYLTRGKSKEVDPKIHSYITKYLKQGQKYPQIKNELMKAGWSKEDIEWSYKETIKKNYQKYSEKKPKLSGDRNKFIVVIAFSVLVIIGALFIFRGVTTGKAIQFPNEEALAIAVQNRLTFVSINNPFYNELSDASVCVQVVDGPKQVSFVVNKESGSRTVQRVTTSCENNPDYDGAVKFSTWQGFNFLTADLTCQEIRDKHLEDYFVLSSRYVLPGFALNPIRDYSPFCDALSVCLTNAEKAVVGCPVSTQQTASNP